MTDIRVAAEQARVALTSICAPIGSQEASRVACALLALEAALAAQPEQQQGQGLVHPAMSTSGRTSVAGGVNAPGAGGEL